MVRVNRSTDKELAVSEYLLFEVANGILVSISEEIKDVVFNVVFLQVVHQVGTVAL